jgi:hypothetical protein
VVNDPETVKYICEGCGTHIEAWLQKVPDNHMCMSCGFVHSTISDLNIVIEVLQRLRLMKK